MKPILRWAGSKRQLIPKLREYWRDGYSRYVEPFAGSCSLFFDLEPTDAMLSDKNSDLIKTYEVLRDDPIRLHRTVASYPLTSDFYYDLRSVSPLELTDFDQASRFVYLNRNAFNGIYRTNMQGKFNVPYGRGKAGQLPGAEAFIDCAKALERAKLRAWDFGTALRYVRAGDFAYLDPPYAVTSRRVFTAYGPKEFTAADLDRLFGHLRRIDSAGATFLLSYADCKEVRDFAKQFSSRRVRVRRNVAGFAGARRHAYELLVTNQPTSL